jgi:hypothetical protein
LHHLCNLILTPESSEKHCPSLPLNLLIRTSIKGKDSLIHTQHICTQNQHWWRYFQKNITKLKIHWIHAHLACHVLNFFLGKPSSFKLSGISFAGGGTHLKYSGTCVTRWHDRITVVAAGTAGLRRCPGLQRPIRVKLTATDGLGPLFRSDPSSKPSAADKLESFQVRAAISG